MPMTMPMPAPMSIAKIAERLVAISDFSQGKAGKIFADVATNDNEYIVLKNNKPTAILMSIKEYTLVQKKIALFEQMFEEIENFRLLEMAQSREGGQYTTFEDFIAKEGFNIEEVKKLSESIEFE